MNAELDVLAPAIDAGIAALQPGGRCAVLAYHSGEDRIVKARLRHAATGGWTGPAHLPPPCDVHPTVRLLKAGSWTPTEAEAIANPRASSARLRAAEKLAPPGPDRRRTRHEHARQHRSPAPLGIGAELATSPAARPPSRWRPSRSPTPRRGPRSARTTSGWWRPPSGVAVGSRPGMAVC